MFTGFSPYVFGSRLLSGASWQQRCVAAGSSSHHGSQETEHSGKTQGVLVITHSELTMLARVHPLKSLELLKIVLPVEAGT